MVTNIRIYTYINIQVPILEHGDVQLIESAVCAEYVAETFPGQVRPYAYIHIYV